MDYVKNHLKQLRRLGLINYIFFLIGLIFLIPGIVLALTRMFDAGYALIGVGLFVLAIAFIIYVYLICFGFKIKNYLMNPKSFLVSLFLWNYWSAKIARVKDNETLENIFAKENLTPEFPEEETPDYFDPFQK